MNKIIRVITMLIEAFCFLGLILMIAADITNLYITGAIVAGMFADVVIFAWNEMR